MAAARFYIDAPLASGARIELPAATAHHAARVLRLRDAAQVVLFNGHGGEFAATVSINGRRVWVTVGDHDSVERESPLAITLVQAWIASDKLDWSVEKAVELGIASIVLAPTRRSVLRMTDDRAEKRLQRLREIVIAACAQCGRNRLPQIDAKPAFAEALRAGLDGGAMGLLLEPHGPDFATLPGAAITGQRITLVIGPEGGFDEDETQLAAQLGYRTCRLGPRIMRTETAGIAAIAAMQAIMGDLAN